MGERRERRDKKNGFFGGVQNTYSTHQSKYNDELTGIFRSSAIHQGVQNHHFIPSLILHEHFYIIQGAAASLYAADRVLGGLGEPVDVALRHVGGVPAVEDVGAHVAPVLLVNALAVGRAVAAVVESQGGYY